MSSRKRKLFQFNSKNKDNQVYLHKYSNIDEFLNNYNDYIKYGIFKEDNLVFNVKINKIMYLTIDSVKNHKLNDRVDLMNNVNTISDLYQTLKNNKNVFNVFISQQNQYKIERKNIYSIDEVYNKIKYYLEENNNLKNIDFAKLNKIQIDFDGDLLTPLNENIFTYFKNFSPENGIECPYCGMKASFFAKERFYSNKDNLKYHLALYGINKKGKEVLFTKDHIFPKTKGGANNVENYQTMCSKCNCLKSDTREEDFKSLKMPANVEGYRDNVWVVPIKEKNNYLHYDVFEKKKSKTPIMRCHCTLVSLL